ncbi:MAG: tetratricopeptide repeat protein [Deltaproteobacteria bacterium]|nr:tetratricopeptide repeat protein [Deltaproteobacteria bacterium]
MDNETLHRLERGREHYANREYDKAEPYLLKVAEAETGFADVMNMLGVIYHDKGQVATAQEYFENAVRLNPRYTEAALNLAVTYNEQGMYTKARAIYDHVSSLHPRADTEIEPFARGKLANMHAELGRAYAELGIVDKAADQYREALILCPDFADIRTRLGQTLKDAGRLEEAVAELEKVKATKPGYVPARISLGVAEFARGDKRAARQEWAAVLALDPENKTANMYLHMVDQLIAQDEASAEGVRLDVEQPISASSPTIDETDFTFDGEQASVMPAPPEPEKN